jgi:hypothetical protein
MTDVLHEVSDGEISDGSQQVLQTGFQHLPEHQMPGLLGRAHPAHTQHVEADGDSAPGPLRQTSFRMHGVVVWVRGFP